MSVCKHRVMDMCKKDDRPCIFSPDCFEPEEEKHMTNADHIRAMTDEELAEFLIDLADDGNLKIREWLQKPAEEDDHES